MFWDSNVLLDNTFFTEPNDILHLFGDFLVLDVVPLLSVKIGDKKTQSS